MSEIVRIAQSRDAAGIARVHVASSISTYRGITSDEYLDTLSVYGREKMWRHVLDSTEHEHNVFVAERTAGQIVGFVSGGIAREDDTVYKSELYAIYLLKEVQGQGLGRRLVQALVERLLQAGYANMFLWAIEENPACRFYERLGGQVIKHKQEDDHGKTLEEVAYGWQDIRSLMMNLGEK